MYTRRAFSVFIGMGVFSLGQAASPADETQFSELLLDTRATIKSGQFSYNDYDKIVKELVKAADKYVRRDGKDQNLITASDAYIAAKKNWDLWFEAEDKYNRQAKYAAYVSEGMLNELKTSQQSADEERDRNFNLANEKLDLYIESKKSKKSPPSNTKKKAP